MIRIYHLDKRLADVEVLVGKLRIVSYVGDWVAEGIESMRKTVDDHAMTELYDSLLGRLQGLVWAGCVD